MKNKWKSVIWADSTMKNMVPCFFLANFLGVAGEPHLAQPWPKEIVGFLKEIVGFLKDIIGFLKEILRFLKIIKDSLWKS